MTVNTRTIGVRSHHSYQLPDAALSENEEQMPFERGSIPLYYQLRETLRNRIVSGDFVPGDKLPTEEELREEFEVSLITVRRALSDLTREGLLERIPGKGTFVQRLGVERDLGQLTSFSQEMERRKLVPSNQVMRAGPVKAPQRIIEALQLEDKSAPVFCLERIRMIDDTPLMLEVAYLPAERFPNVAEIDWTQEMSLYRVMLETYHVRLVQAREFVEPVLVTEQHATLLDVKPFSPALHLETLVFTFDGEPVEFTDAIVPGQRSRYFVNLSGYHGAGQEPSVRAGRSFTLIGLDESQSESQM
jgi:GntR family transcriptional regulator